MLVLLELPVLHSLVTLLISARYTITLVVINAVGQVGLIVSILLLLQLLNAVPLLLKRIAMIDMTAIIRIRLRGLNVLRMTVLVHK